jgi:hypothetical protein
VENEQSKIQVSYLETSSNYLIIRMPHSGNLKLNLLVVSSILSHFPQFKCLKSGTGNAFLGGLGWLRGFGLPGLTRFVWLMGTEKTAWVKGCAT